MIETKQIFNQQRSSLAKIRLKKFIKSKLRFKKIRLKKKRVKLKI